MAYEKYRYSPIKVGVDSTATISGNMIGGFLCVTGGTVTLVNHSGVTLINAMPVTAGQWTLIPFLLTNTDGQNGGTFTTAGGASGVIGV